jgi:hypothetical protein
MKYSCALQSLWIPGHRSKNSETTSKPSSRFLHQVQPLYRSEMHFNRGNDIWVLDVASTDNAPIFSGA